MSKPFSEKTRRLLSKQPARTLLFDMSSSYCHNAVDTLERLCDSLEDVLSVASSFSGPCRIPLLSIIMLNGTLEVVLPLSCIKNNFGRVQLAFEDVKKFLNETSNKHDDCFAKGLQEACAQFRRHIQSTVQPGGISNQLEIILVSFLKPVTIQHKINHIASNTDMESIKRIQVISLSKCDQGGLDDSSSNSSQQSSASESSGGCALVDIIQLDDDSLAFQNFFKSWLLDSGTDCEHMHLILPPSSADSSNVVIKCDLHERVLNPEQLPCNGQYTVHPDSATMKTFPSTSKALGMALPIYSMRVSATLNSADLCDSIVFGMPMIAQPTACWKIDWDELDLNQQTFRALCHSLLEKDLVLICQLGTWRPASHGRRTAQNDTHQMPRGYFALLPAPNDTLLVKSLAAQEFLLPSPPVSCLNPNIDDVIAEKITSSLDKIEHIESYNPFLWTSGLFDCLKSKHKKAEQKQLKRNPGTEPWHVRSGNGVNSVTSASSRPSGPARWDQQEDPFKDDAILNKSAKTSLRKKPLDLLPFPIDL